MRWGKVGAIAAPRHTLGGFASGVAALNDWLRRHAGGNQETSASRTYVIH